MEISATLTPTTLENFCCVTEGCYLLDFQLKFEPKGALREGDVLRFGFQNLFTDEVTSCERPLSPEEVKKAAVQVWLLPDDVNLAPASYYVRVDALRNGESLCGPNTGSCELYVCRKGESVGHALGSFLLSRVAYTWDPEREIYYQETPQLPPTGDPFHPESSKPFWSGEWKLVPELQHDGGLAFLYGAQVFYKTGEIDRARFCDTVLRRTLEADLKYLLGEDGKIYAVRWEDGNIARLPYYVQEEEGWLLKLFSQSYLHFREVVGDRAYADSLFQRLQPLVIQTFQQTSAQPDPLGYGGWGCKCYDGRILAGLAYYCLAERVATGQFNADHVRTTLDFARRAAEHLLAHKGWYDNDCTGEGGCHIGFGNQNILCGLLPSRRIALAQGEEELAKHLGEAIMTGLDFLARTNGAITGHIEWIPSRHSQWANGNMHEILDEIRDQFGESETLEWYYANLWKPTYGCWVAVFHRCNVLATALLECEEYKSIQ